MLAGPGSSGVGTLFLSVVYAIPLIGARSDVGRDQPIGGGVPGVAVTFGVVRFYNLGIVAPAARRRYRPAPATGVGPPAGVRESRRLRIARLAPARASRTFLYRPPFEPPQDA